MRKVSFIFSVLALFFLLSYNVNALENEFYTVSEETIYLKTITYYNSGDICAVDNYSIVTSNTYEISEEEYNNSSFNQHVINDSSRIIETTYKKMTTSILTNGNYFRYKNVLIWKNMPTIRSFDIIAIGFLPSVKLHSNPIFLQEYCISGNGCKSNTSNTLQIFSSGVGTSFKLPTGDLYSLKQTFYFDVEKNTSSTIISQNAYGDYAHATKIISETNAKKYSIVQSNGIVLSPSISDYYDKISVANASWSGSW